MKNNYYAIFAVIVLLATFIQVGAAHAQNQTNQSQGTGQSNTSNQSSQQQQQVNYSKANGPLGQAFEDFNKMIGIGK